MIAAPAGGQPSGGVCAPGGNRMRIEWGSSLPSGLWLGQVVLGALLTLFGILIVIEPRVLTLAVAGVFVFAGLSLLGLGLVLRRRVSYRRLDERDLPPGPHEPL